ncbi:beta-lactamase family protein [Nakamurella flava]|uniref:Beta-lactamase family protein n=1 Tax=Nakamurella flava TaxID=2576308 RepID=A0A4U6QNY6_9ACTN|nr:serine hydrolase domain-containing protein [Nakamurella flava]TKV61786.1 beta-lactamase family protein [Nakamurella flava]
MDLQAATADWAVGARAVAVIDPTGVVDRFDSAADGTTGARYRWASVTKIISALTVLDATVEGVVSLDDPAGPPGSTLAHLLSHSSGLSMDSDRVLAAPGSRRVYSNAGIDAAAQHLADRTGRPFAAELQERVLDLLEMSSTELDGPPAHGAVSDLDDLAALAAELLHPRLLIPQVVRLASTIAFPGLAGVLPGYGRQTPNDWGLGCEIRDGKAPHWTAAENSPRTFGHFGQSGSFLWVDPDAELACVGLSDTAFGPWAVDAWPVFSSAVLREYA